MKSKLTIIIVFCTCILLLLIPKNDDAYSGRYVCEKNTNESLVLKSNKTFEIHSVLGKGDMDYEGSYTITNNHICLTFNDNDLNKYFNEFSSGQVDGSEIIFSNSVSNNLEFRKL